MVRDVRMRGFAERADVAEVDAFLAEHVERLAAEEVALLECTGRVLAEDVSARVDVPSFPRSAMDGYALRGEETFGASEYAPIAFELIGTALPGEAFGGDLGKNQAIRIMTGAPVPAGADAVVMAEVCSEPTGGQSVEVGEAVPPRKNVGAVGEDIRKGDAVLAAGRRIRPQDAALLSSIGRPQVSCVARPRVRLVITGNELLPAGSTPTGVQIVDSNSVMLRGLVARDGGELLRFEILPDIPERIREAMADGEADVVLVSGGSSVGQEDHAPRLLGELGSLDFHGISMRPSSPAGVGRIGSRFVFLLPGNPVSCLAAYEFFAGPTIRRLGGRSPAWPHRRVKLPLARKIASAIGRTDYVRVAIEDERALPLATSGASILSSTVRAQGAVIVARGHEGMAEGEDVEILLYDEEPEILPEDPERMEGTVRDSSNFGSQS
jgi:molybdopterin molybdotransferase